MNQPTKIESDLWSRLRESMERLSVVEQQKADPAALAERLAKRAKMLRKRMDTEGPGGALLTFIAFHKGPQRYGIPIDEVVEVQALEHFSRVPGAPSFVPGVIHWRGAILSLLDLSRLFEIRETGLADLHTCVIVQAAGRRVAIATGEIEELYSVPEIEVKRAPELPGEIPAEWVQGVHDQNRLILRMGQILRDEKLVRSDRSVGSG